MKKFPNLPLNFGITGKGMFFPPIFTLLSIATNRAKKMNITCRQRTPSSSTPHSLHGTYALLHDTTTQHMMLSGSHHKARGRHDVNRQQSCSSRAGQECSRVPCKRAVVLQGRSAVTVLPSLQSKTRPATNAILIYGGCSRSNGCEHEAVPIEIVT